MKAFSSRASLSRSTFGAATVIENGWRLAAAPLYGGHMLALVIGKYRQRLLEDQFFNFTLRAKSLAHDDVNE